MAVRLIAYYDAKSAKGRKRSAKADFTVEGLHEAQTKFTAWFQRAFPNDELLSVTWKDWDAPPPLTHSPTARRSGVGRYFSEGV